MMFHKRHYTQVSQKGNDVAFCANTQPERPTTGRAAGSRHFWGHAQEIRPTDKDLSRLRPSFHVAQEMGEALG